MSHKTWQITGRMRNITEHIKFAFTVDCSLSFPFSSFSFSFSLVISKAGSDLLGDRSAAAFTSVGALWAAFICAVIYGYLKVLVIMVVIVVFVVDVVVIVVIVGFFGYSRARKLKLFSPFTFNSFRN